MTYYIYILYSESSDRYYIGHTQNVENRLQEHNEGTRSNQSKKYTFKHRPWKIAAQFEVGKNRGEAIKIEKYIKRQKSRKFIEKVISAQGDQAKVAQLVRVPMNRD